MTVLVSMAVETGKERPNIIFILADDLSSHSIGAYGGRLYWTTPPGEPKPIAEIPVRTPCLDRMTSEGVRFNNVLAAPVCSPTRGMFFTGKYNFRIGLPDITGRGGAVDELDVTTHVTLPQLLQRAGYTTAMAGKWHLSNKSAGGTKMSASLADTAKEHVTKAGFHRQFHHENGLAYSGYKDKETGAFMADWIQSWVLKFLDEQAGQDKPFFFYYPHPMPHSPWCPTPDSKADYPKTDKHWTPYFADHVMYLDKHVGQVLDKLQQLGLAKKTLVIFSGDNGSEGPFTVMTDGSYTHGGKFGFGQNARVPLLGWWPGTIPSGSIRDDLVDFTDMMPTLLAVAGVALPKDADFDEVSFLPALLGVGASPRDWILSYRLGAYVIRDQRYGLREDGKLYDLTGKKGEGGAAPIAESAMTADMRSVLERFGEVVQKYNLPITAELIRR